MECGIFMLRKRIFAALLLAVVLLYTTVLPVSANVTVSSPSVILLESSTGQVIYELNATERRSPASITKIMTLLLTFEAIASDRKSVV